MTLVDTGPLVALFDSADFQHERCTASLKLLSTHLITTVPVLTEAFYMLQSNSRESRGLREFIYKKGIEIWFLDQQSLTRSFELMEQYSDHPMDMADASLIAAAEALETRRVLTLDRRDFAAYRIRKGHRFYSVEMFPQ